MKHKKIKSYYTGGFEEMDPLPAIPILQPRLPNKVPALPANSRIQMGNASQAGGANMDLSSLDVTGLIAALSNATQASTTASGVTNDYASKRAAAAANINSQTNMTKGLIGAAGSINPIAGAAAGLLTGVVGAMGRNRTYDLMNTKVGWSPGQDQEADRWFGQFNTGGDVELSSDSFQVKGAPTKRDGNKYMFNNKFIKLDHNEVVKNNFVFSDELEDENGSFAKQAKTIERAIGKAEARAINGDLAAEKSVKWLGVMSDELALKQETLATEKGYRNSNGSTKQNFATGGPLPWDGFDVSAFQKWAMEQGVPLSVDGKWGPKTQSAFNKVGNAWAGTLGMQNVDGNWNRVPMTISNNPQGMSIPGVDGYQDVRSRDAFGQVNPSSTSKRYPNEVTLPNGSVVDYSQLDGPTAPRTMTMNERAIMIDPSLRNRPNEVMTSPDTRTPFAKAARSNIDYQTPLTVGDTLQGIEVGQKFSALRNGVERQRTYADTTPLSRQAYDVAPQLNQNQRNLSNQVAGFDTNSVNLRRALFNNAYANKVNADSQVINQYQQMNNQAQVDYENRLSNQRRYNNSQQVYTDNVNAANRGQYTTLTDNAFTSLGNFGEQLNKKVYANDSLRLYKEIYPDVANRSLEALSKDELLKLLLRNGDQ